MREPVQRIVDSLDGDVDCSAWAVRSGRAPRLVRGNVELSESGVILLKVNNTEIRLAGSEPGKLRAARLNWSARRGQLLEKKVQEKSSAALAALDLGEDRWA